MYDYQKERPFVFTDDGQRMFLKIRDRAKQLLREAGAFRLGKVIESITGSVWSMIACVDRLVEIGELIEIQHPSGPPNGWSQNRTFTDAGERP